MHDDICRKNITILNLFTIGINALMLLPVILPYYQEHLGLTFHDFLIVESVFCAAIIILDVPTGWFADRFGRKFALALGAFTFAGGIGLLSLATGFKSALIAEFTIGSGTALMNGAGPALLYESLACSGRAHEFRKREGFRFALQLYSCAAASIIGGYLYEINPLLPLWSQLPIIVGAGVLALFLTEPERHRSSTKTNPLRDILETGRYIVHGHKEIAGLIVLMMLIFATTKICLWSIQAYAKELGLDESWNGWLVSGLMLLGGISGHFGHKVFPSLHGRHALYVLGSLLVSALVFAGLGLSWAGLLILCLEAFVFGVGFPRAQEAINNLAESRMRATILSCATLATSLGFIPLSQVIGFVTDHSDITKGLLAHAALISGFGVLSFFVIERYHRRNKKDYAAAAAISTTTGT